MQPDKYPLIYNKIEAFASFKPNFVIESGYLSGCKTNIGNRDLAYPISHNLLKISEIGGRSRKAIF